MISLRGVWEGVMGALHAAQAFQSLHAIDFGPGSLHASHVVHRVGQGRRRRGHLPLSRCLLRPQFGQSRRKGRLARSLSSVCWRRRRLMLRRESIEIGIRCVGTSPSAAASLSLGATTAPLAHEAVDVMICYVLPLLSKMRCGRTWWATRVWKV